MVERFKIKIEYLLIAATCLLLLLSYELAFKKTIAAWQLHRQLEQQVAGSRDVTYQPGYLERKNANLDKILALYRADTANYRNDVLAHIDLIAEQQNVKLSEVPVQGVADSSRTYTIQKLTFSGEYFQLLKTLKSLQAASGIGMVRAATIRSVIDHNNGGQQKRVILDVYIEIAL
jgi:hypothetical protein